MTEKGTGRRIYSVAYGFGTVIGYVYPSEQPGRAPSIKARVKFDDGTVRTIKTTKIVSV